MKYGYDLDGVIAKESILQAIAFKISINLGIVVRDYAAVLYRPVNPGVIITGRPMPDTIRTLQWLRKAGINIPVLLLPAYGQNVAAHKARLIKNCELDVFIESEPDQIEYLKAHTTATILSTKEGVAQNLLVKT